MQKTAEDTEKVLKRMWNKESMRVSQIEQNKKSERKQQKVRKRFNIPIKILFFETCFALIYSFLKCSNMIRNVTQTVVIAFLWLSSQCPLIYTNRFFVRSNIYLVLKKTCQ